MEVRGAEAASCMGVVEACDCRKEGLFRVGQDIQSGYSVRDSRELQREEMILLAREATGEEGTWGRKTRQEGLLVRRYFECVLELLRRQSLGKVRKTEEGKDTRGKTERGFWQREERKEELQRELERERRRRRKRGRRKNEQLRRTEGRRSCFQRRRRRISK